MAAKVRIIDSIRALREWRAAALLQKKKIGFVPTMGSFHTGHLSLIQRSLQETDSTVVSIFVNPAQFAPREDLSTYPRCLTEDVERIKSLAVPDSSSPIVVLTPSTAEMYPSGISLERSQQRGAFVEVKGLSHQLEGSIRPHFFRGVATVVTKLLNIVSPDKAYFGQKDAQQCAVVQRLVKDLLLPCQIVVCPTARESSGLAMSSRNAYLSPESREKASILYRALQAGESYYRDNPSAAVQRSDILAAFSSVLQPYIDGIESQNFKVALDYASVADKDELDEVDLVHKGKGALLSAAISIPSGNGSATRILDNVILT